MPTIYDSAGNIVTNVVNAGLNYVGERLQECAGDPVTCASNIQANLDSWSRSNKRKFIGDVDKEAKRIRDEDDDARDESGTHGQAFNEAMDPDVEMAPSTNMHKLSTYAYGLRDGGYGRRFGRRRYYGLNVMNKKLQRMYLHLSNKIDYLSKIRSFTRKVGMKKKKRTYRKRSYRKRKGRF